MHKHDWIFKYQVSHIPYSFNTFFCECGMKKTEREAFDKIEDVNMSRIDDEDREYADKISKMTVSEAEKLLEKSEGKKIKIVE